MADEPIVVDGLAPFADKACPNPVFIIGAPRSGTSIIPWALAHHARFWTSPESGFLGGLFPKGTLDRSYATAEAFGWTSYLQVDRAAFAAHIGLGINALLTSRSGGRRWIDPTPGNTYVLSELAALFPGAQFLHIVRDGRRVVHSMHHFQDRLGSKLAATGNLPAWALDFRASVCTWRDLVWMALDFEEEHPDRCLRLQLEDVVNDPIGAFHRLIEGLGESATPEPAQYFTSKRINSSFGDHQGFADPTTVALEPDPSSTWTAEQQDLFVSEGGEELLRLLGYSPSAVGGEPAHLKQPRL